MIRLLWRYSMRFSAFVVALLSTSVFAVAQQTMPSSRPVIDADVSHTETLDLWPTGALKDEPSTNMEVIVERVDAKGIHDRKVEKVSHPTLTRFVQSDTSKPATAIIVIPGGGYA